MDVITVHLEQTLLKLLGFEDEILVNLIISTLESNPDPKMLFVTVSGFLEDHTFAFMDELWGLLVDASTANAGIPTKLLALKKKEIEERKIEMQTISNDYNRRQQDRDYRERPSRRDRSKSVDRDRYRDRTSRRERSRSDSRERRPSRRDRSRSAGRERNGERSSRRDRSRSQEPNRKRERSRSISLERNRERSSRRDRSRSISRERERSSRKYIKSPRREKSSPLDHVVDKSERDKEEDIFTIDNRGDNRGERESSIDRLKKRALESKRYRETSIDRLKKRVESTRSRND